MLQNEGSKEKKSGMSLSRFHFRFYQFRGLFCTDVMKSIPAACRASQRTKVTRIGGIQDWTQRVKDGLSHIGAPHLDERRLLVQI